MINSIILKSLISNNYLIALILFLLLIAVSTIFFFKLRKKISKYKLNSKNSKENYIFFRKLINNYNGIAYRINIKQNYKFEFISSGCVDLTGYKASEIIKFNKYEELIYHYDRNDVANKKKIAEINKKKIQ